MTERTKWDASLDQTILALRWSGLTWEAIAAKMGLGRYTVVERGRKLGARRRPHGVAVGESADRACRVAGHPETWGLLVKGTVLEGSPYPYPVFL